MATFTLPKNSKIIPGKTYKAPTGATRVKAFNIYRWNPDDGETRIWTPTRSTLTLAARWCWTR